MLKRLLRRLNRLSFCLFKRHTARIVARELKESLLTERWEVERERRVYDTVRNYGWEVTTLRRGDIEVSIDHFGWSVFDTLTVYHNHINVWIPFIQRRCLRSCVRHYLLCEMRRELEFDLRNRLIAMEAPGTRVDYEKDYIGPE